VVDRQLAAELSAVWPSCGGFDLFKSLRHNEGVEAKFIRTSIDIPRDLHRRLHEVAARKGCSARQVILSSIERVVEEPVIDRARRRLDLSKGLVPSRGKPINITTSAQLYDLIEFP
jgi:hypothetical protein